MADITEFGDHVRQLKILKQMCFLIRKQEKVSKVGHSIAYS